MKIEIREFEIKKLDAAGDHLYLKSFTEIDGTSRKIEIFFRDRLEEKKIFINSLMTIQGDLVDADGGMSLINSRVVNVKFDQDFPLEDLSIKDRLLATGLIHEFHEVFRRDKIRAREILKVLGVEGAYAEEILLSRKFILLFD